MPGHPKFKKTVLCTLLGGLASAASVQAAPLDFALMPPGVVSLSPAPNVIISIDNSASMAQGLDGNLGSATNKAKLDVLKDALRSLFTDETFMPNGAIRLAWQSMWNKNSTDHSDELLPGNPNSMKTLDDNHRRDFLNFVNNLQATSSTPSHTMMRQADAYMRTPKGADSPWATQDKNGNVSYSASECRRAYHIFMTDGFWNMLKDSTRIARDLDVNGDGNRDFLKDNTDGGQSRTLPDGKLYDFRSDQTQVYRDNYASTLADWAFQSWATDLQPDIDNRVPVSPEYASAPATQLIPATYSTGKPVLLEKYWSPNYDPATWQHMVTYIIGYGDGALAWRLPGSSDKPLNTLPLKYNIPGPLSRFMTGEITWPDLSIPSPLPQPQSSYPGDSAGWLCSTLCNVWDISLKSTDIDYRNMDAWHATINGRGEFYSVSQNSDLARAFQSILTKIKDASSSGTTGIGASASASIYDDVGLYSAGYDSDKAWSGYVYADTSKQNGQMESAWSSSGNPGTGPGGHRTTADVMDSLSASQINNRLVLTSRDDPAEVPPFKPVAFKWASDNTTYLTAAQKTLLGTTPATQEQVLNFLRGDMTQQTNATPPGALRPRVSRQGDIVNSGIWYVGAPASNYSLNRYDEFRKAAADRTAMIYVGGNDGMLHGFAAGNGSEKIAYVPRGLMDKLAHLANPGYSHEYFVDNTPFSGDVNMSGTDWKTMLVGTLGAGGRGYFILDITDPGQFTEGNASSLVKMDKTWSARATAESDASLDSDIGHIFAPPVLDDVNPFVATQITRLNDGHSAVILGNGYNSANGCPVLLIQYLDQDRLVKISPANSGYCADDNGLSAPRVVDLNGDGTADVVYAGDLKGHMWKFDLTGVQNTDWNVAFNGQPLYTAEDASQARQPIFAPPTVKPNDRGAGGMMVAFGTGKNITTNDRSDTSQQTLYSVLDNTRYEADSAHPGKLKIINDARGCPGPACIPAPAPVGTGVSMLQQQMVLGGDDENKQYWNVSATAIDWRTTTLKGWYLNLPAKGERVLKPMPFYDGSNILAVTSQAPGTGGNSEQEESCSGGSMVPENEYLTLINIMDGTPPSIPLLMKNVNELYSATDASVARTKLRGGAISMLRGQKVTKVFSGGYDSPLLLRNLPETPVRPSWRQL